MSCTRCMVKFGVLKKEHGCANCRYSFCAKCLPHKCQVPRFKCGKKYDVCLSCYNKLTKDCTTSTTQPVPNIPHPQQSSKTHPLQPQTRTFLGDNQPVLPPPSMREHFKNGKHTSVTSIPGPIVGHKHDNQGLSAEDKALMERLEKLKKERKALETHDKPLPTQEEIENRLAALRGVDPEIIRNPGLMYRNESNSNEPVAPTVNDPSKLLESLNAQVNIERAHDGQEPISTETGTSIDPETQDELDNKSVEQSAKEVQELIRRVNEECDLDAKRALKALQDDKELWDRLQTIKQETNKESNKDTAITKQLSKQWDDDEDNSDEADEDDMKAQNVANQIMEEAELDDSTGQSTTTDVSSSTKPSESDTSKQSITYNNDDIDSWCCICNADATLKCRGCDYDPYCNRCYREGHDREDYRDHTTVPLKRNKETTV